MNIGSMLRTLRKSRGMTAKELAMLAGIAQSTISDIENDKISPSVDTLSKLLSSLNISISDFFATDSYDLPPDLYSLIETTKKLPPEERVALNEYLKIRLATNPSTNNAAIESDQSHPVKAQRKMPDMTGINLAAYGGAKRVEDLTDKEIEQLEKDLARFRALQARWLEEEERYKDEK